MSLSATTGCSAEPPARDPVTRPPAVDGRFYPGTESALRQEVCALLKAAGARASTGPVLAATAPHAGYVFSAGVAAETFKALAGLDVDTIVIIGHDVGRGKLAYLSGADRFRTPLGSVPVDTALRDALRKAHPGIVIDDRLHAAEHTVEVQLPFLQAQGISNAILPVLFGDPTPANCRTFADLLRKAVPGRRLFVLASTDLSHYPPYEQARTTDRATLEAVKTLDLDTFLAALATAEQEPVPGLQTVMCARGGVGTAMLMATAAGANHVEVRRYANSGDAPGIGRRDGVVGYGAVLFTREPAAPPAAQR